MAINRGKQFENLIREQFEKLECVFVLRLYDVTAGYKQIDNPCDLVVYRRTLNLFECKAIHGSTLNFKSHIRENQWNKLLEYSNLGNDYIVCGVIVWFIDYDKTFFIDIRYLDYLKEEGNKSFNIKNTPQISSFVYEIKGKKRKVFFEYDLDRLLKEIEDV